MNTVTVVTRYGGYRHLADLSRQQGDGRFLTLCRGTSSWTLSSWARTPDHPSLTTAQMWRLPVCPKCIDLALPDPEPKPVWCGYSAPGLGRCVCGDAANHEPGGRFYKEGRLPDGAGPQPELRIVDGKFDWTTGPHQSVRPVTEESQVEGCSCGMADKGAPGHDDGVTDQSQAFVAIISRRTVGWVDKAVGPFATEAEAQAWLDSMHKPGGVVPMVVVS